MIHNYKAYSAKKQKKAETDSYRNLLDTSKPDCVRIAPHKTIVATPEKSYSIASNTKKYSLWQKFFYNRPINLVEGTDRIATTRNLLDSAIAAAKNAVNADFKPPKLTAMSWIWRLVSDYHLCCSTSNLMDEASAGFHLNGNYRLSEWAVDKSIEETSNDKLVLRDIQSLGYDAEAVVQALVSPATRALVDYFTRSVRDLNPIDCVGYCYTMERLASGVGEEKYLQQLEDLLPLTTNVTRYLRTHSSVGAEIEHVRKTVEVVAQLSDRERLRVARACYETALIYFGASQNYRSDKEIERIIEPLKTANLPLGKS